LETLLAAQPFTRLLGIHVLEVAPGRAVVAMPVTPQHAQQAGYVHGGAVATLCDLAAGYAGFTLFPPEHAILTVEIKVNFLAPARGTRLVGEGTVQKHGRTLTVTECRIFAEDGAARTLCASAQQTLISVVPRNPAAA
jgi:uncharacterized protein (TIGR00369 family)